MLHLIKYNYLYTARMHCCTPPRCSSLAPTHALFLVMLYCCTEVEMVPTNSWGGQGLLGEARVLHPFASVLPARVYYSLS